MRYREIKSAREVPGGLGQGTAQTLPPPPPRAEAKRTSEVHKTCFAAYRVPGSFLHTSFPGMYAGPPHWGALVPAGALAFGVRTNFVGTKALGRRQPTAPVWRPKAGHHRRRRSREVWNAGSSLSNLGAAICNPITDTPLTSEMRPDLDASAILSRAASTGPRWLHLVTRSQDRPRAPVSPQIQRYAQN